MYEGNFPHKRYKHTFQFLSEYISKDAKVLDLGVKNPFTEILLQQGFDVKNTKGEDLDLDTSTIEASNADVVTAFEIFEHLLSPFTVLKSIKANKLCSQCSIKIMVFSCI